MNTKPLTFIGSMTMLATSLVVIGCNAKPTTETDNAHSTRQQEAIQIASSHAVVNWTSESTIGQIVAERPQTARVFELVGIDYCCGGKTTLGDAASEQNMDAALLLNALSVVGTPDQQSENRNWQQADIGELMDHIVSRHHTWMRRELPPLTETTNTVFRVHGDAHPELKEIVEIMARLGQDVFPHLDEEEQHLFPAIRDLAAGNPPDGLSAMLDEMSTDHDSLGEDLHRLRALTNGFAEPADACAKYREMLNGLKALESDLHTHVHLENNVLLPHALRLMAATNGQ